MTPRQKFLKNLKKGDKIWIALTNIDRLPPLLVKPSIFGGWFDFKGSEGKYCLLYADYDGMVKFPKYQIFPSKKEALMYAMPIAYRKITKQMDKLGKVRGKLLSSYDKLLEIDF